MSFAVKVESEGPYAPEDLLFTAGHILREKIAVLRKAAEALRSQDGDEEEGTKGAVEWTEGDVVMMDS